MTADAEFLARWRKAYAEAFPGRNSEAMLYQDATLVGLLMLEREFEAKLAAVRSRSERIVPLDPKDPQ